MTTTDPSAGIPVPSWLLPVIGAAGTFIAGLVVADDIAVYWRPALVPLIGAVVGMFVARPLGRQRMAAERRAGEITGAEFGEAATYAQAIAAPPAPAPRSRKAAGPKPAGRARKT